VLVQGPPGTGKSHTIANVVGHLLAQNKSILVTSHTSKALSVVREQLAPPLQPLCVSVLQTDEESGRQLEESISGIVNTLASTSQKKLSREIEKLESRRGSLRERRAELSRSLLDAVEGEYRAIDVAGEALDPGEAARFVTDSVGTHDWIPGPVVAGELPLTEEELAELYEHNAALAEEDESVLASRLPDPTGFPSAAEFASLHDDLAALERSRPEDGQELWRHEEQSAEDLAELCEQAKQSIGLLQREAAGAARPGSPSRTRSTPLARRSARWSRSLSSSDRRSVGLGQNRVWSGPRAPSSRISRTAGSSES
jgi:hypothetical protein